MCHFYLTAASRLQLIQKRCGTDECVLTSVSFKLGKSDNKIKQNNQTGCNSDFVSPLIAVRFINVYEGHNLEFGYITFNDGEFLARPVNEVGDILTVVAPHRPYNGGYSHSCLVCVVKTKGV